MPALKAWQLQGFEYIMARCNGGVINEAGAVGLPYLRADGGLWVLWIPEDDFLHGRYVDKTWPMDYIGPAPQEAASE